MSRRTETVTSSGHQGANCIPDSAHTHTRAHTKTHTQFVGLSGGPKHHSNSSSGAFHSVFHNGPLQSLPLLVYISWALTAKLSKQGQEVEARVQVERRTQTAAACAPTPPRAPTCKQERSGRPSHLRQKNTHCSVFFFLFFFYTSRPRRP